MPIYAQQGRFHMTTAQRRLLDELRAGARIAVHRFGARTRYRLQHPGSRHTDGLGPQGQGLIERNWVVPLDPDSNPVIYRLSRHGLQAIQHADDLHSRRRRPRPRRPQA